LLAPKDGVVVAAAPKILDGAGAAPKADGADWFDDGVPNEGATLAGAAPKADAGWLDEPKACAGCATEELPKSEAP